ncbi:MAG: WD40 repeat domain-containing protein, partial [Saprospiraceae bacterium]|nr:WD40 repeat domain-containing protein [Saprospiraceae bacterium]
ADSRFVAPNANGSHLFIWQNDSILLAPIGQPDQTTLALPAPPDADIPGLLAAQHWLAFRDGDETIVLFNTETRQQHRLASPRGGLEEVLGAFRPDEREFVCISEADSATVYQLPSGTVAGGRRFGGAVAQLSFVPQTNEVLVVHYTEGESGDQEQTVIKLWNPAEIDPDIPLRSVRLQGYETREVAFSKRQDGFIAFTNGLDVRIFRQNDLLDETVRIRQNGSHMVTALEFHPDGGILAAGYEDGSVIFWNVSTGQARFTWPAPAGMDALAPSPVVRIRFVEQGRRLLLLFQNNLLLLRDLELSRIRAGVQTDFRKLISFQPSEIREYDLEQAFDHRNNFSRLAASGDLPLVRSFFDYFRETALFSNNVQRVGYACDRAASLFSQLDADTREVLQAILLEMLEDYHWKLLLRNQTAAAARVASVMQRDFDNPVAAELAYAHTALLDDDAPTATRRYAAWAFRKAETSGGLLPPRALDSLYAKMVQLLEYSLIQPEELDAVCSLFGGFPPFDQRCQPFDAMSAARLLPAEMALRWRIFQQLNQSQFTNHHHKRVGLLEAALADTRQLRRLNTAAYADNLENVVLALGQAYTQWAIFEQNQAYALAYYQKALDYLSANGPFASPASEQRRQNDLIANCLYLGNTYQNRGQLPEAGASYQQGLQTANQLLQQVQGLPALFQKFQNENNGPLNTQLGYNFLLQGNAGAAFQAFEQAQNDRVEGIHRLFFGHAALLDNDPANASLEYANILTEASLGQALFDIERMAGRLPTHRARLLDFAHTLRQARLSTRQQLDSTATDYYRAYLKINLFGAQQQWDSAQYWSAVATELAERVFYRHPDDISWQNNWLDALLNQTYYLLYSTNRDTAQLGRAIRLSLEAQQYFEENDRYGYYPNQALIHTNLAHAYWLRQQPGDRERALAAYLAFLNSHYDAYDPWELLLKDFRDLRRAGVPWPDLPELLEAIRPEGAEISPADQEALGR